MRIAIAAAILALAACEPAKPVEEATAPTPEELGQDDPDAPFNPAPVGEPKTYEAFSKTAMSFTPGVLTLTPTAQKSPNLPPGAVFAFGNGIIYETTLSPGGATMGPTGKPADWANLFIDPSGAPIDAEKIEMYSVDTETVPPGTPNGGFCEKTSFLATYIVRSPGAEDMTIAAFSGDQWPPKDETALCGTFTYAAVH
ncbi:MAG: hypothetical protein Q8R02_04830 [Hyphomonadaceae bacterium]|nr:hypothetical protein [Hyphomonadaceae bacterium]